MKKWRLMLAAVPVLALSAGYALAEEDGLFPSSYTKKVCERLERSARTERKHRAYAINVSGDHCGSAYGYQHKKDAEYRALSACRKHTKEKCRLVFSE